MILRDASMKDLTARRDELRRQAAAIDDEIARRYQAQALRQQQDRAAWERSTPRGRPATLSGF